MTRIGFREHTMGKESSDFFRAFVENRRWQYAKTMPKWPHVYTVREWDSNEDAFEKAVSLIREHGQLRYFFKKKLIYMDIDGYTYWTMGADIPVTKVINRCSTISAHKLNNPVKVSND